MTAKQKTCAAQIGLRIGLLDSLRVALFLAKRQLTRSARGTTALIVFIMTLTFLNLTVVGGILIGLVEGSSLAYRSQYSGDVLISELDNKRFIVRSQELIGLIEAQPETAAVSGRYLQAGRIEANWKQKRSATDLAESTGARIAGIDPKAEDGVTGLAGLIVDGRYLDPDSSGQVLIGSGLLARYSRNLDDDVLKDVGVGDRIRLVIGGNAREMTVRGVVKSKIGEVNQRVFMTERELRQQLGRDDLNVNEIALRLESGTEPSMIAGLLLGRGFGDYANIETWEQAQGTFFKDVQGTFAILGDFIGSIALAVAAITVFIVILINVLSRKREIGIMKGIGICGRAIGMAYVFQALAYAVVGTLFGLILLFAVIEPYFKANPIDFPFSDGILAVTVSGALWRGLMLLLATALAGWLPARGIIRENTLDTILGR